MAALLIDRGAAVDIADDNGQTALFTAALVCCFFQISFCLIHLECLTKLRTAYCNRIM